MSLQLIQKGIVGPGGQTETQKTCISAGLVFRSEAHFWRNFLQKHPKKTFFNHK